MPTSEFVFAKRARHQAQRPWNFSKIFAAARFSNDHKIDLIDRKCVLILSYDITANSLSSYVLLTAIMRQNFD